MRLLYDHNRPMKSNGCIFNANRCVITPLYRKNAKIELKPENWFRQPPKPKTGFENYGPVLDSLSAMHQG